MQRELEYLLNAKRWAIMQAISQGKQSATSIASNLKISITYANTQLQLLEAKGYLKRDKEKETKVGKPRTRYSITKDMIIIASVNQESTFMHAFKPGPEARFITSSLRLQSEQDLYYIQKFYYTHEELILSTQFMALIDITPDEIHFLAITKDVENIRKHHSNITITNQAGKKRKIILWSHTKEEVLAGLRGQESYYLEKIKTMEPYWEREVSAAELQEATEEPT